MLDRTGVSAWTLLVLILLVSGCVQEPGAVYEEVPPQTRTILFPAPLLEGVAPEVRVRVTEDSREEFARWDTQGARAGLWHGVTFTGRQWPRTPPGETARALRYWRDLREPGLSLEEGGAISTALGDMRYWRFRLQGGWYDCFAVNHFWTPVAVGDDGPRGYRDWLNGYYCTTDGDTLTEAEIADMLSGLRIDRTRIFPAVGGG